MPESGHAARRPWVVDAVALGAMLAGLLSLAVSLSGRFALDIDDVNLSLAIEKFDVRMHQPHPPGYLGYVLVLRAVHALFGGELLDVPRWVARACGVLTVLLVWRAARSLGGDPVRARWAALLAATNPIILYYSVDGQTHSAEGAMSAALIWALVAPLAPWRRALACGLLVAAGGSFRPTYLMLSGVAVLWVFRRDWRHLLVVGALAAAGTVAWLLPTVKLTGGWAQYRAANDALVGMIARQVSVFSSEGDARYMALNLRDTLAWSVIALAPLGVLAFSRGKLDAAARHAAALCVCIVVPSLIFYSFGFCMEAGYLAGLVAPVAVLGGLTIPTSGARAAVAPSLVAAAQLAFFLVGPQHIGRTYMLPNVAEIVERDVRVGLLYDALHHGLPPDERILIVTDFPDLTAMRQQPLVRPASDVLFAHDKSWFPAGGESWISFATAHGWHALPGIVLRNDGNDEILNAGVKYSQIALDPRASERLRSALGAQMRCPVAPESDEEARTAQRWPMSCFGGSLDFYGRTLRF